MRALLVGAALIGGLVAVAHSPAQAQTCVEDQFGRIVCGQRVLPNYGPSPRHYEDGPRYYDAPRYYRREPRYYGPPRPVVGTNGTISCMNPNYTWQNGACRPYRGPW